MATKLSLKNAAANPVKWDEEFLAKVAAAGDHLYFTRQIFQKWWKLGLDKVFAAGAQLDLLLDEHGFTWTIKTANDAAAKLLAKDDLAKVEVHKGKCSGFAPKVATPEAKPEPKAETKPAPKPEPKPEAKPEPKVDRRESLGNAHVRAAVRGTPPRPKEALEKYVGRVAVELSKDYKDVTAEPLKLLKELAQATYFKEAEPEPTKPSATPAKQQPTLTTDQAAAVDAAMRAAQNAANGPAEMLDNDAQVELGDAITAVFGGKYPTHSRGGGHKGSFNKDKSIQQQLSNIAAVLNKDQKAMLNDHFGKHWAKYSV